MMFYFIVLWSLIGNSCLAYPEREDFNLDGYEAESRAWKSPHSDVFAFSEEPVLDKLSELSGTARDAVDSDQLHAAFKACNSRMQFVSQQVRNNDIIVQRFIKHLVRIYDESMDYHEGIILMKLTAEDMKVLKSFADDGKFVSNSYNNIHDLLRVVFTVPTRSTLERILPMMNIFAKIWKFTLYIFQEIRFILMQFVLSSDVVIYLTMILPPLSFLYSLRRGHSVMAAIFFAGGAVALIAYFAELRSEIEAARAKDMARLIRSKNIPPECTGADMGYFDWAMTGIRSMFSGEDRCESYFREQIPEASIEPSQIFWKIVFTPLTVAMDKFGDGLWRFTSSFGGKLGWFSSIIVVPVGIIALLYFLALLLSFISGGSINLPLLGRVAFWNPSSWRAGSTSTDTTVHPPNNSTSQPAIANSYTFNIFNASRTTQSEIPGPAGTNMSISVPDGPTLQLMASPTSDINIISSPRPTEEVVKSTAGEPGTNNDFLGASEQPQCITALSGRSQNTTISPAGSSREHQSNSSGSETSHGTLTNSARHSRLFSAFSEREYCGSVDSSSSVSTHCALKEIGGGDFLPRDLSHQMLPSGVLRWRSHHRKLSL